MRAMRKTKEEAKITRSNLLDAALKVFSKKGYVSTTLDDIAREAGVTRGAVYWHFKGGKPEIYQAILNQRFERVETMIESILAGDGTPLEKLERLMIGLMIFLEEDADYRAVQELMMFKTEMSPELAEGCMKKYEKNRWSLKLGEQLISQAKQAGEVRADVDPEKASIAAIGLLNGVIILWLLDTTIFPLKDYAPQVVRTFIDGISVR